MYPIHFFDRAVRLWPDHIAVEHGDRTLSYKALHDRVQALAVGLQTLDPEFGSRVGICCYNSIDHLISWLAVLAAGKVWVPLQPMNATTELLRAIEFTEATIVVAQPDTVGKLADADVRFLMSDPNGGSETTTALCKAYSGQSPAM